MLRTYSNPTAGRASLGRVPWIDKDQRHSSGFGFVRYELPELVEGPTSHKTAQTLTLAVCALTDALQVLHTYKAIGFLGKPDYALADVVVQVLLESAFSAGQPFQDSLGAFCASPLKRCLGAGKLLSLFVDLAPRKHEASGSCCDAVYPQIHAQRFAAGSYRGFGFNAEICVEQISAGIVADCSSADLPTLQELSLVLAQCQYYADATAYSGECGLFLGFYVAEQMVVNHNTSGIELLGILLVGHAVTYAHSVVSGQPILFFDVEVVELLQFKGVAAHLLAFDQRSNFIAGSRKSDHCFRDSKRLSLSQYELAFHGLNHSSIIDQRQRIA